jgi:hypothetical protein
MTAGRRQRLAVDKVVVFLQRFVRLIVTGVIIGKGRAWLGSSLVY